MAVEIEITELEADFIVSIIDEAIAIGEKGTRGDYTSTGLTYKLIRELNIIVITEPKADTKDG